jgi:hypothetical protein
VQISGGPWKKTLPDAWRCTRIWGAQKQQERTQARPIHEGSH